MLIFRNTWFSPRARRIRPGTYEKGQFSKLELAQLPPSVVDTDKVVEVPVVLKDDQVPGLDSPDEDDDEPLVAAVPLKKK